MLFFILLFYELLVLVLSIYLLDFRVDGKLNDPLMIGLGIVIAFIVLVFTLILYIDGLYFLVAKRKPKNSMFKHRIAKQIMTVPLYASNTRIKVTGIENLPKDPGFSIYSNHTSMMDIPVLMYGLYKHPVAFLAKKVVRSIFSFGKWTPTLGCVSIDRTNDRKAAESVIEVIRNVKNGLTMVVFPEGTRSLEIGTLLDFKPGSFKIAMKSKKPLVPITIKKPLNFQDLKWPRKKPIEVVIHKPIEFKELKAMNTIELSSKVKTIIESELYKK